jgi:hypothetical protein
MLRISFLSTRSTRPHPLVFSLLSFFSRDFLSPRASHPSAGRCSPTATGMGDPTTALVSPRRRRARAARTISSGGGVCSSGRHIRAARRSSPRLGGGRVRGPVGGDGHLEGG